MNTRKPSCDGCHLVRIQGKVTHEHGCPYSWINPNTGEGYEVACHECGYLFVPERRGARICLDCLDSPAQPG